MRVSAKRKSMAECRRWRIEGRVQGVFFRASTRRQAERLGLTGHAINQPDRSVDVLACGSPENLDKLHAWLRKGPPAARVDNVVALAPSDAPEPEKFTTA